MVVVGVRESGARCALGFVGGAPTRDARSSTPTPTGRLFLNPRALLLEFAINPKSSPLL